MAHCVYCMRPEGECSKVRNALLKACSKWFTKNSLPENARVVWIVECVGCGLQTCSWYLALSQRRMAKSSKRSHSKSNSLPPAKQFDFTMVDEELQRSVSEENVICHPFQCLSCCDGSLHWPSLWRASQISSFLRSFQNRLEDLAILHRLTVWTFSDWASTRNTFLIN